VPNRSRREDSPHRDAAGALGGRIRAARLNAKVSQQALASGAGVAIGTLRALESKRSVDPSLFTILALARELNLDVGELLDGLEE
jgi:transcriptional regulator with XRE-family HTH domain